MVQKMKMFYVRSAVVNVFVVLKGKKSTYSIQVSFDLLYSTSEEQEDWSLRETKSNLFLGT